MVIMEDFTNHLVSLINRKLCIDILVVGFAFFFLHLF